MELSEVKVKFPEYKKILEMAGGMKPRKFVKAIKVVKCPVVYNPSGLGDCAYRHSYFVDETGKISAGYNYSYESMMAVGIKPVDRMVDVPKGSRMWIVTFDGMWGGFWEVQVFIHELDMIYGGK